MCLALPLPRSNDWWAGLTHSAEFHALALGSGGPNRQLLPGNLDHLFRHHLECVDIGDALNLREELVQQSEIALGDADDYRDRLLFGCAFGVYLVIDVTGPFPLGYILRLKFSLTEPCVLFPTPRLISVQENLRCAQCSRSPS